MLNRETASVSNARLSVEKLHLFNSSFDISGQLWIARFSVTTQDVATGRG